MQIFIALNEQYLHLNRQILKGLKVKIYGTIRMTFSLPNNIRTLHLSCSVPTGLLDN